MKLSSFSENIITEIFERSGESVTLKLNIDAVVPEYHDMLGERLKPTIERLGQLQSEAVNIQTQIQEHEQALSKPSRGSRKPKPIDATSIATRFSAMQKEMAQLQREIHAEKLTCPVELPSGETTCILKGWDLTDDNGLELAATKENLLRLPPNAVKAIWEQAELRLSTVKKKEESETRETSETTRDGSPGLRVVAQTG